MRDTLEDLAGVASVRVSYRTGIAEIRFDATKVSVDQSESDRWEDRDYAVVVRG